MIKSSRNQMANIGNPFQGDYRRVLCVCSAGLLRSPTLANVLNTRFDFNTRACGTAENFALIPLSEALIHWADEIVFTDEDCKVYMDQETREELSLAGARIITLDLPDEYDYNDPALVEESIRQYIEQ